MAYNDMGLTVDGANLTAELLMTHIKFAFKEQVKKERTYTLGWIDYFVDKCRLDALVAEQYGVQVEGVTGNSDSFYVRIKANGYLRNFLQKYNFAHIMVLEVENTTGDGWSIYEDAEEVDSAFYTLRLMHGDDEFKVEAEVLRHDFKEAVFMQKLAG